jgi:hypothetical protein
MIDLKMNPLSLVLGPAHRESAHRCCHAENPQMIDGQSVNHVVNPKREKSCEDPDLEAMWESPISKFADRSHTVISSRFC